MEISNRSTLNLACILCIVATLPFCVDPVTPEFDYRDGLVFIDAFAVTEPGQSYVDIKKSVVDDFRYRTEGVSNATVELINAADQVKVILTEEDLGVYAAPLDFKVNEGETWQLEITFENGQKIISTPEKVSKAVPLKDISARYSDEIIFDEGFNKFIPGHAISLDFDDPPGEENFYIWKYRTFEPLIVCKTCEMGRLRGGVCEEYVQNFGPKYFNYLCDTPCWTITYGEEVRIFEDRLSDGAEIRDYDMTVLPYYRSQDIAIEVQQFTLSKSAFEYYKVIDDLLNESTGLNAPPPAALFGNLSNAANANDPVLGQFVASSVAIKSLFINRQDVLAQPLTPPRPLVLEPCALCPDSLRFYPCMESRFRSPIKPQVWN